VLIHIVSFKYKSTVDAAARAEHRDRLRTLAALDGVRDLRVGGDIVGSARSFDTGLVMRFADRAGLDAYQKDARHVPVAQYGASLCDQIVSVDFLEE